MICTLMAAALLTGLAAGPRATATAALEADGRLSRAVSLETRSETLRSLLAALSKEGVVPLTVDAGVANRRATCILHQRPLLPVMRALARVTHLSWRPTEGSPAGYELYQTHEQQKVEQGLAARSEERERRAILAQKEGLVDAIHRALSDKGASETGPAVAGLLRRLSPAQIGAAATLATIPQSLAVAGDPYRWSGRVISTTRYSDLPSDVQSAVQDAVRRAASMGIDAPDPRTLAGSQVGLVASSGAVNLSVIPPGGGPVWVSGMDGVRRPGIPGVDSDDDQNPEVAEGLQGEPPVVLYDMTEALRGRKLTPVPGSDLQVLPDLIHLLSKQTGLSFVVDDYIRSRETTYPAVLERQPAYTLEQALREAAVAFGHRFLYDKGIMRGETATPGLDLRAEPPPDLVVRLRRLDAEKKPLSLEDYLSLARLADLQLATLESRRLPAVPQTRAVHQVLRLHPILRFYADLTEEQRRQADSPDGLSPAQMNAEQQEQFRALASLGLPSSGSHGGTAPHSGIFARCETLPGKRQALVLQMAEGENRVFHSVQVDLSDAVWSHGTRPPGPPPARPPGPAPTPPPLTNPVGP